MLGGARGLILPEEVKMLISDALSEYEAADFGDMVHFYC